MLACGRHAEFSMFHALGSDQSVGDSLYILCLAFYDDYL